MKGDVAGYFGRLRAPARARGGQTPFWVLVAVTATGTLAMHILVPVLPLAAADFGVSRGTIQLAVTLYLFGIAGGQLLYGPVSDRFGRRPTLLTALGLYVAASAAAGWAAGIATLLVARSCRRWPAAAGWCWAGPSSVTAPAAGRLPLAWPY
jgi:DHA1 family bicyclomycin/chloramphenicol resistance-like MFS transporter